jgi:hypothetical protein
MDNELYLFEFHYQPTVFRNNEVTVSPPEAGFPMKEKIMQRKFTIRKVVHATLTRFNLRTLTALRQVGEFHERILGSPISNNLVIALAIAHYRHFLLNAMKKARALREAGLEQESADFFQNFAGAELVRRERMRNPTND